MTKEKELLKQFVKDLINSYPLADKRAIELFEFYKKWIENK